MCSLVLASISFEVYQLIMKLFMIYYQLNLIWESFQIDKKWTCMIASFYVVDVDAMYFQ